jgi:hypothetical protein
VRVALALAAVLGTALPSAAIDLDLYARLLEKHTRDTQDLARVRVDYRALRRAPDWPVVMQSLEDSDPAALDGRAEQLAFWINAYNILAIDTVVRNEPRKSIKDVGSLFRPVWKRTAGYIDGQAVTLDQIEHEIVRPMGDPRTHAALNCASLSCPALLREPWLAETLDAQLDGAVRAWLADTRKGMRIVRTKGVVRLSAIFDWFPEDFEAAGGVLAFVARHASDDDRAWLEAHPDASIDYFDYDWRLNAASTR